MAGELNTDVLDDPASCRAAADWLGRASVGVKQVGDVAYQERGQSESFWQGAAGDACRAKLSEEGHDSDDAERLIAGVQQALLAFAREIDAVKTAIDGARKDASAAGLLVTPTAILPPGPAPTPLPDGPVQPSRQAQYNEAVQAYQSAMSAFTAKQQAFDRAQAAVNRARGNQTSAHQALDQAMIDPLAGIKRLKTYAAYVVGAGLGYVKSTQAAGSEMLKLADDINIHSDRMQAIADDPTLPEASRAAATRAASMSAAGAEETMKEYKIVTKPISKIPTSVRGMIEANPGAWIVEDGSAVLRVSKGALEGLPFVGTGVALASGAMNVALGEPPGQAAAETGASLAGAGVGGASGAASGALIGSVFPGPGTAVGGVIGGVVGGMIGAVSATQAVDEGMGVPG